MHGWTLFCRTHCLEMFDSCRSEVSCPIFHQQLSQALLEEASHLSIFFMPAQEKNQSATWREGLQEVRDCEVVVVVHFPRYFPWPLS